MCVQDPSGEAASQAQKHLTYYELDLGLNHVLRKWSEPIDNGANLLIPVPGGGDGPGGVLVAADNFIIYRDEGHEEVQRQSAAHSRLLWNTPVSSILLQRLSKQDGQLPCAPCRCAPSSPGGPHCLATGACSSYATPRTAQSAASSSFCRHVTPLSALSA